MSRREKKYPVTISTRVDERLKGTYAQAAKSTGVKMGALTRGALEDGVAALEPLVDILRNAPFPLRGFVAFAPSKAPKEPKVKASKASKVKAPKTKESKVKASKEPRVKASKAKARVIEREPNGFKLRYEIHQPDQDLPVTLVEIQALVGRDGPSFKEVDVEINQHPYAGDLPLIQLEDALNRRIPKFAKEITRRVNQIVKGKLTPQQKRAFAKATQQHDDALRKAMQRHEDRRIAPAVQVAAPDPERVAAYQAKIQKKNDRLKAAAKRARSRSAAAYAQLKATADRIPLGQPILVDHYSARRHRRDIGKMDRLMRTAVEERKKAERLEQVADDSIRSDDPEAAQKIQVRIQELTARRRDEIQANQDIKKLAAKASKGETKVDYVSLVDQLLAPEAIKNHLRSYARAFPWLPQFQQHTQAEIRRLGQRLKIIQNEQNRPNVAPKNIGGASINEDKEANRLQIIFNGKPSDEMRSALKSAGFRWAPSVGAWQRQLNNSARWNAEQILKQFGGQNG